jgi:hypothetical protein
MAANADREAREGRGCALVLSASSQIVAMLWRLQNATEGLTCQEQRRVVLFLIAPKDLCSQSVVSGNMLHQESEWRNGAAW